MTGECDLRGFRPSCLLSQIDPCLPWPALPRAPPAWSAQSLLHQHSLSLHLGPNGGQVLLIGAPQYRRSAHMCHVSHAACKACARTATQPPIVQVQVDAVLRTQVHDYDKCVSHART